MLGARDVVPHLSSQFAGFVLTLPSIPIRVTVLHVPTMCDDLTVVASVNLQGGTVSRFVCLLTGRFIGWFECLDLHLHLAVCQGSPLFWQISSAVGFSLWEQRDLSTCRWRPLFCALGASRCLICSRRVSPRCFPYSVPSSRITGWSSWMCFAFIGPPWVCTLPVFPFVRWGVAQVGETILSGALVPQMRAQSHWETVRSSGAARFSLAVTTPHRL